MRFLLAAPLLFLAACSPPNQSAAPQPQIQQLNPALQASMSYVNGASDFSTLLERPADYETAPDPAPAAADPANTAVPADTQTDATSAPAQNPGYDPALVRIEALMDRAHFSPGVIDGYNGDNVRKAVRAYQSSHQLTPNGRADADLLQALTAQDQAPALVSYTITPADVAGPFVQVPSDFEAQSQLAHLGYQSAKEEIAEKFHMDQHLLTRLNPNVDFTQAGATIVVANVADGLSTQVASIVVDKQERSVRALDSAGNLVAFFPATIGSQDTPAPSGDYRVANIDFNHTYRFRPDQLPAFHGRYTRAFDIQPGPNNPTGSVWIALSRPTYGIHGSPEPALISKTESHGCVRLTNWDALELAHAVHAGVPVSFRDVPVQTASNADAAAGEE